MPYTKDLGPIYLTVGCRARLVDNELIRVLLLTMFENTLRSGSEDTVIFKRVLIQSRHVTRAFRKNEGKLRNFLY